MSDRAVDVAIAILRGDDDDVEIVTAVVAAVVDEKISMIIDDCSAEERADDGNEVVVLTGDTFPTGRSGECVSGGVRALSAADAGGELAVAVDDDVEEVAMAVVKGSAVVGCSEDRADRYAAVVVATGDGTWS